MTNEELVQLSELHTYSYSIIRKLHDTLAPEFRTKEAITTILNFSTGTSIGPFEVAALYHLLKHGPTYPISSLNVVTNCFKSASDRFGVSTKHFEEFGQKLTEATRRKQPNT